MRFLADAGISPRTVEFLTQLGHDAVHARTLDLHRAADHRIVEHARADARIVVTFDLDFGDILALGVMNGPSVIIFRLSDERPAAVNPRLSGQIDIRGGPRACIMAPTLDRLAPRNPEDDMKTMPTALRRQDWRQGLRRSAQRFGIAAALAIAVAVLWQPGTLHAQLPELKPAHLNPVIEKLAANKAVFGAIISDLSMTSARQWARSGADYVWVDMEHSPLNMDALNQFVAYAHDHAYTARRGDTQPRMAIVARFPPYGGADSWIVKQALDMGLMGVVFNTVNTKEEAIAAVRSMRYPPQRNDPPTQKGPAGFRGFAPGGALWNWGISGTEYQRRADVWPLNPNGDLLANIMIETREAVDHIDEIASVPGIGVIEAAAGGDLSADLGIANQGNSPEVEALRQRILKACQTHNVVCGILASGKTQIDQRLKEGWRFITTSSGTAAN